MNRIDRLTAILIQLQSKKRVPLVEIEDRFEIGRRTVFRDIRALIEAGVPIGGDAASGYFIVEGYHLPPVMLSKEEAAALLLGGKLLAPKADEKTYKAFEEALLKIKAVLRYSDKDYLQTLEDKVQVFQPRSTREAENQDRFFPDIQKAVAGHCLVDMLYYSNYTESVNQRKVAPLGLVYYNDNWHVIAYCFLRQQIRDFRTTRIQQLLVLEENFDPSSYQNYEAFLTEQLNRFDAEEAIVEIRNDITRFVADAKYHYGFVSERKGEKWTEMKFVIPDQHFFVRWMMMHGKYGRILSPPSLVKRAKELSKELFEHYK